MDPFREGEGFAERKVDPLKCGTRQLVPALVAERSRRWSGKGGLIEPLIGTAVLELRVPDHIRKPAEVIAGQRVRVGATGHDGSKGLPALDEDGARKLPAAHEFIEQEAVVQELL